MKKELDRMRKTNSMLASRTKWTLSGLQHAVGRRWGWKKESNRANGFHWQLMRNMQPSTQTPTLCKSILCSLSFKAHTLFSSSYRPSVYWHVWAQTVCLHGSRRLFLLQPRLAVCCKTRWHFYCWRTLWRVNKIISGQFSYLTWWSAWLVTLQVGGSLNRIQVQSNS